MNFLSYRDYRQYLVLNLIQHLGPISRTRLVDITGYRPAAIGEIISALIEERLIVETGSTCAGQGRRRVLLELNAKYICAIGVSINSGAVVYIVSTIGGDILRTVEYSIHSAGSSDQLIRSIIDTINTLIAQSDGYKILGIGICDPGRDPSILDTSTDFSESFVHFNDWVNYDLRAIIENAVHLPVEVSTRGILISVAEEKFGVAQGMKDFICLELCNGIGMSFFSNGSVVGGATDMAGQIGHTIAHTNQKICYCGKPGCVEYSTTFPAIRADILGALSSGVASKLNTYYDRKRELSVQDVRQALDAGDKMCCHFVKQAALLLGVAVANAVNILNPECVIFHGYMLELGSYFMDALIASIRDNSLSFLGNVELKLSPLLETILPLGAAAMIFNQFLKSDEYKWVYNLSAQSET